MWYEDEGNQFVRAPTPHAFDQLVQNLEDDDSVLFQSISLPNLKQARQSTQRLPSKEDDKVAQGASSALADYEVTDDLSGSINMPSSGDYSSQLSDEVAMIKARISQLEKSNKNIDILLQERDEVISDLHKQIREIKGASSRPMTHQSPSRSTQDSELLMFYKSQYESTLLQYEKLKEALNATSLPNPARAQSARAKPVQMNQK